MLLLASKSIGMSALGNSVWTKMSQQEEHGDIQWPRPGTGQGFYTRSDKNKYKEKNKIKNSSSSATGSRMGSSNVFGSHFVGDQKGNNHKNGCFVFKLVLQFSNFTILFIPIIHLNHTDLTMYGVLNKILFFTCSVPWFQN